MRGDPGRRIAVIGTTGSGKSTLARALARQLDLTHIELDALHWGPGWTEADPAVLRDRADRATSGDAWVTDGNYRQLRDIVWKRAETVIWLDYPFPIVMARLIRRSARRVCRNEELWNGNRETIRTQLSRESVILWAVKTHWWGREHYAKATVEPRWAPLRTLRFRHPARAEAWLGRLRRRLE